jgi:Protein of unknown function (DUF1552)
MYITKKHLSRRTVLRGLGVAISLPLLDAMMPAFATEEQTAAARQMRFGGVYVPNGALPELWHPKEAGRDFTFTDVMKPLEPFRKQLITVSGMVASGKPAPHAGASCGWLNGVGALGAQGEEVRSKKTLDQHIVDKIGQDTPLPSLEVGTEDMGTLLGASDGYSCLYYNALSWHTDTGPRPVEINPRLTFERMFGETGTAHERLLKLRYKNSVLDSLGQEANRLSRRVGASDKRILNTYLDNVREVETHLQKVMKRSESGIEAPAIPAGIPESFEEHIALTYDLMHLAYQGDISRVFTFLATVEASNRGYAFLGVPESHHAVSHHGGNAELKVKYMKIVSWHVQQFANFVQKLKDTPDGDGNLLDHSLLYYGSGMSNGNAHDPFNPPAVAVGGANGKLVGNLHVATQNKPSASNFLLNLGAMCGLDLQAIGPSTGPLTLTV